MISALLDLPKLVAKMWENIWIRKWRQIVQLSVEIGIQNMKNGLKNCTNFIGVSEQLKLN